MKEKIKEKYKLETLDDRHTSIIEMVYIFIICAFLGWCVEISFVYLSVGKITSRGMMYGPFCSIYGFGAIILYLLFYNLKPKKVNIPYVFFTSSIVMGAFELLCGLGFKHILNIEMWNYHGQFLNILDYTTVPILLGWGVLGTIYTFFLQPFLYRIIDIIPENFEKRLAIFIVIFYFINFIMSSFNIYINPEVLYNLVHP